MRWIRGLVAIPLAVSATQSVAQDIPAISLAPGEAVTISFDGRGRASPPLRSRAQWSAFDVYAARHLTGLTPPEAPVTVGTPLNANPGDPQPDPVPEGQVRMRFLSVAGRHTILVLENGLQHAIGYRAQITAKGDRRPTDVCIVLAGFPSYEHWPYPIERIELTDFQRTESQPGQMPACK